MRPTARNTALRHARVLNAAYADGEHAGCFGWCMFDYATHKDFGSGDRICYHGVLDSFRNPKLAAAVYASQGGGKPILTVSSTMDIGDSPAGQLGTVYVFTNAERVDLYKNDVFVTTLHKSGWTALPHPPLAVDDTIGELLGNAGAFRQGQGRHAARLPAGSGQIRPGRAAAALQVQVGVVHGSLQNEL